jgi:hypothetical protein
MNEQERGAGAEPKPLPAALTLLLGAFGAKTKDGTTNGTLDAQRIAAMIGIQRHAESDSLPAESRAEIQRTMLALLKQKQPPAGRDQAVHDAMRRRAAETLGLLTDAGTGGAVAKAIDTVLGDPTETLKVRGTMAQALGMLKYPDGTGFDLKAAADHAGRFAVDACGQELQRATTKSVPPSKRRLRSSIKEAREAIGRGQNDPERRGIWAAVSEPGQQKFVEAIGTKLKALDALFDDAKLQESLLSKNLADKLKDLEQLLAPRGIAPNVQDQNPVVAPRVPAKKQPSAKQVRGADKAPGQIKAVSVDTDESARPIDARGIETDADPGQTSRFGDSGQ